MLKTSIKHYILDTAINSMFDGIIKNYHINQLPHKLIVGKTYYKILTIDKIGNEFKAIEFFDVKVVDSVQNKGYKVTSDRCYSLCVNKFDDIFGQDYIWECYGSELNEKPMYYIAKDTIYEVINE